MTGKRYGFTLGLHNEFKDIVDHCRQDKHISVFELMKQVNEQDKEFKKLKRENEQLKQENQSWLKTASHLNTIAHEDRDYAKRMHKENAQLKKEIISLNVELDTHKHPLWSTREAERIVNELKQENEQLKQENNRLIDDVDYFKTKSGSLEDGYLKLQKLNDNLYEENQELKQSNKDARHILEKEFYFASEQRQKHLDDPVVAKAYDIIRFDIRKALDKLGDSE